MKINFISDLHLEFGPMEIELDGGIFLFLLVILILNVESIGLMILPVGLIM